MPWWFFCSLTFVRTFCTALFPFCYLPVVTSPKALSVFIINAPLISTSLRRAGWLLHLGFHRCDANSKPLCGLGLLFFWGFFFASIALLDPRLAASHKPQTPSVPCWCQRHAVHSLVFPGPSQCYCKLQLFSIIVVRRMHELTEYNAHAHLTLVIYCKHTSLLQVHLIDLMYCRFLFVCLL